MLILALQAIAVIAGLFSAFFWWRSSAKPTLQQGPYPSDVGAGAQIVAVEGGFYLYDYPRQSRLSALGAMSAAVSILAQAITVVIGALPQA